MSATREQLPDSQRPAPLSQTASSHVAAESPVPLRVLVLAPHPFIQDRGTPIAVYELVRTLAKRGCEVEVLTYHEGDDRPRDGWSVTRIPAVPFVRGIPPGLSWKKLACDLVMLFRAIGLLRRRRFDLVHAVEEASFIGILLHRLFGVPYVYDMDSSLPQQLNERYAWLSRLRPLLDACERLAIRGSIGVVAVSRSLEELARAVAPDTLVARLEDFSLLSGDGDLVRKPRPTERLRETIQREGPLAVYVGNLMPYQGIDLLLEGFCYAAERHAAVQLVIIGGAERELRSYSTKARRLGVDSRVHLLGPRPLAQLGWYLAQADVLVSPRITGTNTPMKIYSYLDSGAPLLATRLPTHTQVLDDSIAYLVEPEPRAFGEGLLRLLEDEELRRSLADRAAQRVRTEHSCEAFERKLNEFYDLVETRLASRRGND